MHTQHLGALEELEKELARAYDQIAQEYKVSSHETLRNFEILTLNFLQSNLLHRIKPGQRALDLGGGRGYVSQKLAELGSVVILGDISKEMLKCTMQDLGDLLIYCCLSAFRLPFRSNVLDVIFTLLCEGYLRSEVLAEVHRVLKPGGLYVITQTPKEVSRASQLQKDVPPDRIWFKDDAGNVVLLPFSYAYTLDELVSLIEEQGLTITVKETLRPEGLIPSERISTVNKGVAEALGLRPQQAPLLSALVATKLL